MEPNDAPVSSGAVSANPSSLEAAIDRLGVTVRARIETLEGDVAHLQEDRDRILAGVREVVRMIESRPPPIKGRSRARHSLPATVRIKLRKLLAGREPKVLATLRHRFEQARSAYTGLVRRYDAACTAIRESTHTSPLEHDALDRLDGCALCAVLGPRTEAEEAEVRAEDLADAETAATRLAEIEADPSQVVSGDELVRTLDALTLADARERAHDWLQEYAGCIEHGDFERCEVIRTEVANALAAVTTEAPHVG